MDYKIYKEAKEYVKYWEQKRHEKQSERLSLKNPILTTKNYFSVMNYRLYKIKKEYSDIIFLLNHDPENFGIYRDHAEQLLKQIFKITRNIREAKTNAIS